MSERLNGRALAKTIRAELTEEIQALSIQPGLAVILVGNDPASQIYVKNKQKMCGKIGAYSELHQLPEVTPQEDELIGFN